MWLAVIISVFVSVEIFTRLTGEDLPINSGDETPEALDKTL